MSEITVCWFRRDLRLHDNPALLSAAGQAGLGTGPASVVPLFVLDPALWDRSGAARQRHLRASLGALAEDIGGPGLVIAHGDPAEEVVRVARAAGAAAVHIAADYGPYGQARDDRVRAALADHDIALVQTGSPYAVAPGRVRTQSDTPFAVFTPFYRAWLRHGWRDPAPPPSGVAWIHPVASAPLPTAPASAPAAAGERAALRLWAAFRSGALADYDTGRDRPDLAGTSTLSTALKFGEIHPRTLLADLVEHGFDRDPGGTGAAAAFARELAWREFWADVLFHRPAAVREDIRPEFGRMRHDEPGAGFAAWCAGRTGFPLVDAGMRQLAAEGWLPNRVRMVTASFLVKDLHVHWRHGARWFLAQLRDGDLATNHLSWQWVAGCGTDAAPYFRVFNPVGQGVKFDPNGDYVRRWIPELAHLAGPDAHGPWEVPGGYDRGYPERIVDHQAERSEALARLAEIKTAAAPRDRPAGPNDPQRPGAGAWVPADADIVALAAAARACQGCELAGPATQTVFSKGAENPRVVLVGEQPGDAEDRAGLPFVGPAGKLLDRALAEAGFDFGALYVTNAVKHFRHRLTGTRRLHQTPEQAHVEACRPWLRAELSRLRPEVIIALGATAGRALLGPRFRVTRDRGVLMPWPDHAVPDLADGAHPARLLATLHPSAVLRADDSEAAYAGLVADLRVAAAAVHPDCGPGVPPAR